MICNRLSSSSSLNFPTLEFKLRALIVEHLEFLHEVSSYTSNYFDLAEVYARAIDSARTNRKKLMNVCVFFRRPSSIKVKHAQYGGIYMLDPVIIDSGPYGISLAAYAYANGLSDKVGV
jgi:hypothetical protein